MKLEDFSGLSKTTGDYKISWSFSSQYLISFFTIVYKHMLIFSSHLELEDDRRTVETSFSFSVKGTVSRYFK